MVRHLLCDLEIAAIPKVIGDTGVSLAGSAAKCFEYTPMSAKQWLALMMLIVGVSVSSADSVKFAIAARDPGVSQWISFEILGPQNHPYPIVYISTEHFETMMPEFLIVLPPDRYRALSDYEQAHFGRPECLGADASDNLWYSVEIVEGGRVGVQRCALPQALACASLSETIGLSSVHWTAEEVSPIKLLMNVAKCTASHAGTARSSM